MNVTPILFDARVMSEPNPTGVTVVAQQFLQRIQEMTPRVTLLTTNSARSNSLRNARYAFHLERATQTGTLFLPNINFIHASPAAARIQVVHDLSFVHAPYWYGLRSRLWHTAVRVREQLVTATRIVAVSEWTKQDLMRTFSLPPERIHVIHPHTPAPQEGQRPQLHFSDEPFFLFLGTLESRKNIAGLIEAFVLARTTPTLIPFHLVIAGRAGHGAPDTRTLPPHIQVLPYPEESHKWWLLRNATALVYPSFFEGFGLPPLEAAAVGCPVIASDRTAIPETMDRAALYVSPYDLSQIVIALEAFAVDHVLRDEYATRGVARAQWYSVDRQRESFLQLRYACGF